MVGPPPNGPATPTGKPKHMRVVLAKIDIFHESRTNVGRIVEDLSIICKKKREKKEFYGVEEMQ